MPEMAWASVFLSMYIAFLDEFGHIGPFVSRKDPRFNESPIFGLAGVILPDESVRNFATWFFQPKGHPLKEEILKSGIHPATWEKKGSRLFTPRSINKSRRKREAGFRIINKVMSCGGKIFYYGREKWKNSGPGNPMGPYTTVLSQTIRRIDVYCEDNKQNFIMIMDEHSGRKQLIETAAKTMFGSDPARRLLEPPFEVESYLYQTVQAADWISSIIGRLWKFRIQPAAYQNCQTVETYFGSRIDRTSTHSTVFRRSSSQPKLPLT